MLLQVGLVDAGEALGKNHLHVEETRFHGCVLTRRALAVVVLSHHDAADALRLVCLGGGGNLHIVAVELVLHLVALAVEGVHGTHQEVVGDILQVSTELQPRTCHGDVVGGTLALGLDEQRHVYQVLAVPRSERCEFLQAVAVWGDDHLDVGVFLARSDESLVVYGESLRREGEACRRIELHAVAILVEQGVGGWIEVEATGDGQCHGKLWATDEGVCIRVAIGTTAEVAVEGGDNGVLACIVVGMALPLTDTWSAGVGHNQRSNLLEVVEDAVTLGGIANLLRTWVDDELTLHLDTLLVSLAGNAGGTSEVLVRGVGAATNQAYLHYHRIVVGRTFRLHVGDRCGSVWSERTVQMWLHLGEVDFHDLVVESRWIGKHLVVGTKFGGVLLGEDGNLLTSRLAQVLVRILVEWEDGASGTQFGAHVTDGSLAGGGNAVEALAEVFEDGIGATLHGEDAENFEDHILRSSPSGEFSGEMHTDEARHLQLPRLTGEHIDGVGATYTHSHHAETSGIRGMRIGTHHHAARKGIVFEHYLMDDSGTWSPEADVIFLRDRLQEVVYLFISLASLREVFLSPHVGTNQVIAMN